MKRRLGLYRGREFVFFLILVLAVSSCGGPARVVAPPQVFVTFTPTPTPVPPTPALTEIQFGDAVPSALREQVNALALPAGTKLAVDISLPDAQIMPDAREIRWVYVLAAPFPTIRDGVTADELRAAWSGTAAQDLFSGRPILMDDSALAAFTALWGAPASGSVRSVPADQILGTAWSESTWAIIPFESLSPKWKVLMIDGQSPIRKGFDVTSYPLVVSFSLQASGTVNSASLPLSPSNYDAAKVTTVILTGVTALVRATAFRMEQKGTTYPGEDIRDLLRQADIAHISNEIPFMTGCPAPNPNSQRLVFCSDPKYIDLLTDVGMDVVELTGNHFADYGREAMAETLAIYQSQNIPHFGGGADLQDSFQPALFDINGSKIAFLGCNRPDVGGPKVASEDHSGAAPCDFDYFTSKILELKEQGYLVIFTFQWYEDYAAPPNPDQVRGFYQVADAGATIVSGSQAHFPKIMEFHRDSFLHYGLGNLFFDQMGNLDWQPEGIRREFLDRYVIYDSQLISVELITAMLEDFSRPRLMTDAERAAFLQEYFDASGWATVDPTATSGTSVP